jgi:hypothetical protein
MKWLQIALCIASLLLAIATVVLPVVGAAGYFDSFKIAYSNKVHAEILVRLLAGPALALSVGSAFLLLTLQGKRIPIWLAGIGVLGALFSFKLPIGVGHDFSHVVFNECSGKYGLVVFWLGLVLGILLAAIYEVARRRSKLSPFPQP